MNIEILDKHIIKITLSSKDMKNYGVSYEKINYNDKKTRQLIVSLLYKIKKTTNIDISKSKIFIEAFPTEENGCILYLNIISREIMNTTAHTNSKTPIIIKFKHIEDFKNMCKILAKKHYINKIPKNSLLQTNNCFILTIYSNNGLLPKISPIFLEYGTIIGHGELSKKIIDERCHLIIKNNAIETILKKQIK